MSLPSSAPSRPVQVCAIVINYFGSAKTRHCLESLAREGITAIYLADNSTDAAEHARLEEVIAVIIAAYPAIRIELVINTTNLGFGRTHNELIAHDLRRATSADYYLLINNDAELCRGAAAELVRAFSADTSLVLAAPCVRTARGVADFFHYWRYIGAVSLRPHRLAFPYLTGCCLMAPRWFAASEPLFDSAFFMYGEDVLLSWRVHRAGLKVALVAQAEVLHEGTGSSRQGGLFYEYHVARGHVLLAYKMTRHIAELPLLLVGRAALLLCRAVVRALRYRSLAPLLAYALCWRDIPISPPRPPQRAPCQSHSETRHP